MRLITSSVLAGIIAVSSVAPAFADQRGRGRGHDKHDRYDRRDNDRYDRRDNDRRNDRWNGRGWYDTRGSHRDWRRGDDFYRYRPSHNNYVVVNDYNRYRLAPPRYGERYYRNNDTGEILLIAAATGLVLWALTN